VLRDSTALYATNIGTTEFMAPEMIDIGGVRERHYGEEVDIWSLGMVLFELMALDVPFREHDRFALPRVFAGGNRPAFPPTVGAATLETFRKVFEQCTERVPGNRPTAVMVQSRLHRIQSLLALKQPILGSSSELRTGSFD
jgi:serine/threonine protein kinase